MFHVHLRKVVAKGTFFESLKCKKKNNSDTLNRSCKTQKFGFQEAS